MQISKLKKEINDELTTMESQCGDMDIKEMSFVDRSSTLNITYKTASPIDPRKAALGDIKDKIRDAVRFFNEDFGPLTDAEMRGMCKDVFPQLEGWNDVSNTKEMPSISKKEFDSLVSDVLEEFPDASLSECYGHPVINYYGRQFDLENTYFLSKRPDFVRLLEQDMRNFKEYVRAIKDQK